MDQRNTTVVLKMAVTVNAVDAKAHTGALIATSSMVLESRHTDT